MYAKVDITHDPSTTKIALLAGGTSGEREISLHSAEGATVALEEAGYPVVQLDPANKDDLARLVKEDWDVAFLCTHGKGGEDGAIQGFCQTIGLPYTCPGIFSSAVAIDKSRAKVFYRAYDIPTPESIVIERSENPDLTAIMAKLGTKVVVKAATEGSSIGVYITEGENDFAQALHNALEIDKKVVVEQYVAGREFTCVVLGSNEDAGALPVIEIIPKNASYDFESKYAPGGCEHLCPAPLDDATTETIQQLAVRAHNALGCEGVSRTDFLLDSDGSAWALETNTIPGMTATSLLPDAAAAYGISFPELCKLLVQMALDR